MFVWGAHNGRAFTTKPLEPGKRLHRAYLSAFNRGVRHAHLKVGGLG